VEDEVKECEVRLTHLGEGRVKTEDYFKESSKTRRDYFGSTTILIYSKTKFSITRITYF